ncbi:MAG: CHAT domain-containing tetratricopeptide repeat protein [Bacteroidota bacterium]
MTIRILIAGLGFLLLVGHTPLSGQDFGASLSHAEGLMYEAQLDEAAEAFRLIAQQATGKQQAEAYLGLAEVALLQADTARFFQTMQKVSAETDVDIQHKTSHLNIQMAFSQDDLKRVEELIKAAEQALPAGRNDLAAWLSYDEGFRLLQRYDFLGAGKAFDLAEQQAQAQDMKLLSGLLFLARGKMSITQRNGVAASAWLAKADTVLGKILHQAHPYRLEIGIYQGAAAMAREQYRAGIQALKMVEPFIQQRMGRDHPLASRAYYYHGNILLKQKDYQKAIRFLEEAVRITILQYGPIHRNVGAMYNSLGLAHYASYRFDQAGVFYEKALETFQEILPASHAIFDMVHINQAWSLIYDHQYEKAAGLVSKVMASREVKYPAGHLQHLSGWQAQARIYEETERYEEAVRWYQKCIRLTASHGQATLSERSGFHNRLSRTYRKMGELELAHQEAKLGIQMQVPRGGALEQTLVAKNLGGDAPLQIAKSYLQAGLSKRMMYAKSQKDVTLLEEGLAFLEEGINWLDYQRQEFLSESANMDQAEQNGHFFSQAIWFSWKLFEQSGEEAHLEKMFNLMERSKGVSLRKAIRQLRARENLGLPLALLDLEDALNRELLEKRGKYQRMDAGDSTGLVTLGAEIFKLETRKDSLLQAMESSYPDYFQLVHKRFDPTVAWVREQLQDEEVVLASYYLEPEFLYGVAVSRQEFKGFRIALDSLWEGSMQAFISETQTPPEPGKEDAYASAQYLYQQLIAPLEKQLVTQGDRWIIIPHQGLSFIPFAALLTEAPSRPGHFPSYPYAARTRQFSYLYTVEQLQGVIGKAPEGKENRILAFAPSFNGEKMPAPLLAMRSEFSPLAYNQQEVNDISSIWPTDRYLGVEATKEAFLELATRYPILHLSSHARAVDDDPLASHVAFSLEAEKGKENDALLTLSELYHIRLTADLVVLSACETAKGKVTTGEGMISLARGFTYAGASSLVTSLWQINDAATAELMETFYRFLAEGKTKDQALREAQISYLTDKDKIRAHPYFWAGLVPFGDMQPIQHTPGRTQRVFLGVFLILCLMGIASIFVARFDPSGQKSG